MMQQESRSLLTENFKTHLSTVSSRIIDNKKKYIEISPDTSEAYVYWSLDSEWYIEGELYDESKVYEQRKVILNLVPGDFLVIPAKLPLTLRLYARTDQEGECVHSPISSLLKDIRSKNLLNLIANKITRSIIGLSQFEKEVTKTTLKKPQVVQPGQEFKLAPGRIGVSNDQPFWVNRKNLSLFPKPRKASNQLPQLLLIHSNTALLNDSNEVQNLTSYSNEVLYTQPTASQHLTEQISFHWAELVFRWQEHFKKLNELNIQHSLRNDIYSQSIRGRLLNLLSGHKSYLPKTENHTLRAAFYLINKQGWIPSIPKKTEANDPLELLDRVTKSSGLILRKSTLRANWWKKDSGSFISFGTDQKPLVLFFKRGKYYQWNPQEDRVSLIHKSRLIDFDRNIVYFYKQLPAQPLSLVDLVLFEVQSVRFEISMVMILAIIMGALVAVLPMLSGFVVNVLLPSALTNLLAIVCGGLVVLGLFQTIFTWFDTMIMTRINYRLTLASNAALWHRVLNFPSSVLRQFAAGDIGMRMNSLLGMQDFFRTVAQRLITIAFQILSSLGVIYWVNFQLGMSILGFGLIAFLSAIAFTYWQIRAFMAGEKSLGIVNSYILEVYSGIHKIKAAGAESECLEQWAERYSRLRQKLLSSQKVRILHNTFQTSWVTLSTALVYWMIVSLGDVDIEPAMFIAFLGAFAVFSSNLSNLCSIVIQAGIQVPMFKFIQPLIQNTPECKADLMTPENISGNLKVDNISYYYPNQNHAAIQQVNLFIKKGSFVVIAGGSGSGKSTLGKLLCGLDQPDNGHVFLDDYELHALDPKVLRTNIAVVPQDFRLLGGTLYENIKGASTATLDEIIEAAKAAGIWTYISELPMKLHTLTSSQFGAFSGGQIQRIAIARALVRKPRILIMDEATSALDNQLQKQIVSNLKSMNCTLIFITHRLKITQDADQIIVMDNGQCVEQGIHKELLEKGGYYAKMWNASS
jgi:ABC-type bacteriocin/lantibiotic exporter with double-glycine peptidase domain